MAHGLQTEPRPAVRTHGGTAARQGGGAGREEGAREVEGEETLRSARRVLGRGGGPRVGRRTLSRARPPLVPGWNPSSACRLRVAAADSVPSRPACPSFLSRGVGCGPPGSAAVSPELRASVTCLAKGLGPAGTQEK